MPQPVRSKYLAKKKNFLSVFFRRRGTPPSSAIDVSACFVLVRPLNWNSKTGRPQPRVTNFEEQRFSVSNSKFKSLVKIW